MNMCRTCLKTPASKDISELEKGINDDNKNYFHIMEFCLDIKVIQDSQITTKLCHNCYRTIISFYKFKALALKNDVYLKSLDPAVSTEDQKLSIYVDENGIKHENLLDTDEYGPVLFEDDTSDVKIEMQLKNQDSIGYIESNEELPNEEQKANEGIPNMRERKAANVKKRCTLKSKNIPYKSRQKKQTSARKKRCHPKNVKQPNKYSKKDYEMCKECGKSVCNLKEHIISHQLKDQRKMVQCTVCPKLFYSKHGQTYHYKTAHLGIKSKCDICNKEVALATLQVHKLLAHNKAALPFGCASCPVRFVSRSAMEKHLVTHTRDYAYECDYCQKKFGHKQSIRAHILEVHAKVKNFQCEFCSKGFFQKSKLRNHLRAHTKERPYKCEECGKSFSVSATLKSHRLIHGGVKSFENDVYLKSLETAVTTEDQKLSIYVDENEIEHKNLLDTDEYGPVLFEDDTSDVKIEMQLKNQDSIGYIESNEELPNEEQKANEGIPNMRERKAANVKKRCTLKSKNIPYKSRQKKQTSARKKRCHLKNVKQPIKNSKKDYEMCEECGKSVRNLKEHIISHQPKHQRKMVQCTVCPKLFYSKSGQTYHYKTAHLGIKSKCDICNKEVGLASLSAHKLLAHNKAALPFGCASCPVRFVSRSAMEKHLVTHTRDYAYECDYCQKKFGQKESVRAHILEVHAKVKNFHCEYCSKGFFQKSKLKNHLRAHTKERPYKCEECGKSFSVSATLKSHRLIHCGVKSFKNDVYLKSLETAVTTEDQKLSIYVDENSKKGYEMCEECGKSVRHLKEHIISHQPKDQRKMLQCTVCPKLFYSKSGQTYHYKTAHLGIKSKCDICNKEVGLASLSAHKLLAHNKAALPFGCASCPVRFVSRSAMEKHLVTHTKDYAYECDYCQKKFGQKENVRAHILEVHAKVKNFQCEFCSKGFYQKSKLKNHLRSHTKERPYKCEECGKSFSVSATLKSHRLIHGGVKSFHCEVCTMSFVTPANLRVHMITHKKEKRFPCQYCGVPFARPYHRRRHEFTAHQKQLAND